MKVKQTEAKEVLDKVVGEESMKALANRPEAVLISRSIYNRFCIVCKRKAQKMVLMGNKWDKNMLCRECKNKYEMEERKWN